MKALAWATGLIPHVGIIWPPLPASLRGTCCGNASSHRLTNPPQSAVYVFSSYLTCMEPPLCETLSPPPAALTPAPPRPFPSLPRCSGTHTHASPAGFLQYLLYDITSLGFVTQSFEAMVEGILVVGAGGGVYISPN